MPSWAPAITSDTFSIADSVVRAAREPPCASGSIWLRRADSSANSAPTKNALSASSTTASSTPNRSPFMTAPRRRRHQAQVEPVDAQAVHPLDGEHDQPLARLVRVGAVRDRHLHPVARVGILPSSRMTSPATVS